MSASLVSANKAVSLADFTSPRLIVPHLRGQDAATVIHELSEALQREKCVPDLLPFYHAALNREFLASSDWEPGLAFPHVRLAGLKELAFALGRSDQPLDWSTKSSHSVRLVFLMAVPVTESTQYLSLISGLARLAKDKHLVKKLREGQDAAELLELLRQIKIKIHAGVRTLPHIQ